MSWSLHMSYNITENQLGLIKLKIKNNKPEWSVLFNFHSQNSECPHIHNNNKNGLSLAKINKK